MAAYDWQGDGGIDISDGIAELQFLFAGGPPQPAAVRGAELTGYVAFPGCPNNDACAQ